MTQAIDVLAVSPDDEILARLASHWCDVDPKAQTTPHGSVRVCYPQPAIVVDGHALVLEMGGPGVIGLVARELSDPESRALSRRARRATSGLCAEPFAPVPPREDPDVREEFHTCPAREGPVITVGRYPVRSGADVWQVSVAVLGTT